MDISTSKDCLRSVCSLFLCFTSPLNVLVIVSAPAASVVVKEVEQHEVKNEQQANSNVKSNKNICESKPGKGS